MKKQYLETGKIVGTHGVKGMVRIQPWSDSAEFLTQFKRFYLDLNGINAVNISQIQPHGRMVIAKIEGADTVEQAEKYRNKTLYISRGDISLPEGRYFVDDLIGCQVYSADRKRVLGELSEVSQTGANDVWHIIQSGQEYLVPAIDEVIVSIDIDKGEIVLNPMKGIFEDAD